MPEGLNFCVAGEGTGAFFPNGNWEPWFYEGDLDDGMADFGSPGVVRALGSVCSIPAMMRAHGTGTPRESWRLDENVESFYDGMEKTIRLRYHLMPYLYTLFTP